MSKSDDAVLFVKSHKKELIKRFADPDVFLTVPNPAAFFMSGSPGAGKTEYSKAFIQQLCEHDSSRHIIRIDADEIRDFLPQYNKTNAMEIQGAAYAGVNKLLDHAFANDIDFLLDSTMSQYDHAEANVKRCIKHNRKISIVYIYQDPLVSWGLTKKREKLEGRPIPKDFFLKSFFDALDTVSKIKRAYPEVEVTVIKKNILKGIEKSDFNVHNVDKYVNLGYTPESLSRALDQYILEV